MPIVGSSMTNTFGMRLQPLGEQHLLLVAARKLPRQREGPGRAHAQPRDVARRRSRPSRAGRARRRGRRSADSTGRQIFSTSVNSGRMPSRSRSPVRSAMPAASEAAGSPGGTGLPSTSTRPRGLARRPTLRTSPLASSPRPGAGEPGDAQHLAGAEREADRRRAGPATVRFSTCIRGGPSALRRAAACRAASSRRAARPWRHHLAAGVVSATGPSATTSPSRITVRSSQTSKISFR